MTTRYLARIDRALELLIPTTLVRMTGVYLFTAACGLYITDFLAGGQIGAHTHPTGLLIVLGSLALAFIAALWIADAALSDRQHQR